ncbi:MAG: CusA/CzcA family heavy metal efflux RND transporter [Sphingobacteriia bacterium 28-36-52]|jgi:cobalt-zinc-cadmium resistance protein CzcA|uniref:CusA/CzcA family heavy metal efflux RND transporter n=1 Tax=Sediminibacterium sp. TaxID=1917865 RepID=UPI000BCF7411|nr:CusA/CzcA family heavy metal efflux RND transporter [Sediminibacterium sp.]OYY09512.1 MAG: CusA/CzcA family heavy metal efflux RND transporter [Sphingobacteriia bacterium 35-36-14]OYZ02093.1 MAG: CusA/CzcA family heavy metal efflux RND transporter [Sphingobacteriia bacterium 28-36-52]OYZ53355.1 MAG: CusA/CzcA family heavy metal efflux RND transporter [Sphingobacteriia bacterium 24-36-13]OZA64765.1 MAG: CusA/CzcA family heavy metal efflux RND transporter [Sphingobacteriia bacterium 39-36-14]
MLTKIIEFSVRNKLIIGLFVIALIGYGTYNLTKLPIDAVPDITNNQVQVITVAPSFGATDIERLVTFPIEQANNNISGLLEIRSFSRFGLSLVTIVFNDETDIYWARQQVAERLLQVQSQIPAGIGTPQLGPVSTGLGEIYQYVIRPEKGYENQYDVTELRTMQDWIVRRQLLGVKGVAEVSSFGGKLKQYSVEVDPSKLLSYNITIADVFTALETNNQNTGGAYIEKGPTVLFIRTEGLLSNIEDIQNIAIKKTTGGTPLFIRDVAEVKIGHATRYGAMTYNDQGEVSGAVVMMLKGANSNDVINLVKERIVQIQKSLPKGVVIEPFLDRTKMVNNAIGTVEKNLLEGALIVVFVLVVFLGNLRAGLIVASVIPLAMLFAIIMMNLFGVSGNLMSLGALDFGLIVDGAVIIVEAVMHQLSHSKKFSVVNRLTQGQMDKEVNHSASKMMNSAVFGQIIILVVYLPIFTLQGIEGKMFKPMAQTVAFALLGAFILSLTYIPMMSAVFLSKKIDHQPTWSDRIMAKLEANYKKALEFILHFPKMVLGFVISLFIVALFILSRLGGEFIPALEEGDFAIDTRVLTGSNLTTTVESTQKAASLLLKEYPEIEKIVTKIGSGEVPTDPMPMEASDLMVILKPKEEWTSAKTFNELADKMGATMSAVPGITTGFQFPVQMRFNELMTGARQDVVCKIFGENLDTLAAYASSIGKIAGTVEGAKSIYVEAVTGMPQILIEYNRSTIAQYNLNIQDINKVVNAAFAGQSSGLLFEGEKRFDLVVRIKGDLKKDLKDIQQLLIPTPSGIQVPLSQLASVEIKDGPNQIQREDAKRRIVIGFNVRGRDVETIVKELQQKIEKQVKFPVGYYITYGGAFENLNAAKARLMIAVPVSLLLIFLLLYFAFNSIKHGLLIYSAIPLSAIGGIFFLALRDMPFSISAGVGFIALFGVAVLNGIVLIAEFNRLKSDGMDNLRTIVLTGTSLRLRPVLMTAFVASLGFLPMALSNGAGAEVQRPLATVVIGGLMIATFLTLFVLPVLYMMFEKGFNASLPINKGVAILLGCLFVGSVAIAQTDSVRLYSAQPISVQAAVDSALKNNLLVKNEQLKMQYQQMLIGTAGNLPKTSVIGEIGQINSIYTDTRLGISQSIAFPTFYKRERTLLEAEFKNSVLNIAIQEALLKKQVQQVYYNMVYLQKKKELLLFADSLYSAFYQKAALRLKTGESNILEKTSAETLLGQIKIQVQQLNQDAAIMQLQLQLLLNTKFAYQPETNRGPLNPASLLDTALLRNHPVLQSMLQQQSIAMANTEVEKSKLLPDLSVGILNGSIRGVGADNIFYSGKRFSSVQVGMGIPLFTKAQKARINSAALSEKMAESKYEQVKQKLTTEYQTAIAQFSKYLATVQYLEKTGLKNAQLITETANKQLSAGSINYLEWVQLINQATSVKNDYTEAVRSLNESIIQLTYYIQQ